MCNVMPHQLAACSTSSRVMLPDVARSASAAVRPPGIPAGDWDPAPPRRPPPTQRPPTLSTLPLSLFLLLSDMSPAVLLAMVVVLAAVGSVASAGCSYRGLVQTTGPRETVAWCCMMDAEEASASTELVVMVDGSASSNQGYVVMPDFTCASLPMASDELDGFIASYASPDFAPRRVNNITADIGRYAHEPAGPWAVVVGVHCLEWVSGCKISVMSLDVTANTTLIAA